MPSLPAELTKKIVVLNFCDLFVAYRAGSHENSYIPSNVRDLLYQLGKQLGIHTAIKAISGYETPRGLLLICNLLGVLMQTNRYYQADEVSDAIDHLRKLGLLD
jgi:hypothetical protein